jgi:GNAT superfamily N-acetyltransferase
MEYQLRRADDADRSFLWSLLVATMKEYVDRTWGWDEADQQRRFQEHCPPERYRIIIVDDEQIGAVAIEQRPVELFLASILILPQHQRKGIGTAIITDVIRQGQRLGLPVGLRVLKVNPAIQLYRRLGFVTVEETSTHCVMRRK